jgi:hypothetical protein
MSVTTTIDNLDYLQQQQQTGTTAMHQNFLGQVHAVLDSVQHGQFSDHPLLSPLLLNICISNRRPLPMPPTLPVVTPNPPHAPLQTTMQAYYQSTHSSRLKTGVLCSGDDLTFQMLARSALDSNDSDFLASGDTRTLIRQSRNTIKGLMTHLSHGQTARRVFFFFINSVFRYY